MDDQLTQSPTILTSRRQRLIVLSAAEFSILVGIVVVVAWQTRIPFLMQMFLGSPPLSYNSGLAFLISGIGLLALLLGWRRWAIVLSLLLTLLGGLTLIQYLLKVDLGIDHWFMADLLAIERPSSPQDETTGLLKNSIQQFFIALSRYTPGRPSGTSALGFICTGLTLLGLSQAIDKKRLRHRIPRWQTGIDAIAAMSAAVVTGIGAATLLGCITELNEFQGWQSLKGMSFLGSLGLLVLGTGLFTLSLRHRPIDRLPFWFPFSIGVGLLTSVLVLWQVLISWNYNLQAQLNHIVPHLAHNSEVFLLRPVTDTVLIGGILFTSIVTYILYYNQRFQERSGILERLNREISQSNALLQATLESTADGILVVDAAGRRVHFNSRFSEIWHTPSSVVKAMRLEDVFSVPTFIADQLQDPDTFVETTQRMLAQLESSTFDLVALKDGRTLERYGRPYWIGDRCVGKVLSYRDITERKQVEDALRQSEERFHTFMNHSPAIAFMKDDQGRYVYINQAFEHYSKMTLADLWGKTDFAWVPPEVAKGFRQNDAQVLATNRAGEYLETSFEEDGTPLYWLAFKFPFQDPSGIRYVGGVAVNITERKQMENLLFQEKELAQVTLEAIGDAVITTDAKGRIQYLNPIAESLTGWTRTEAKGLPITTILKIFNETTRQTVDNPILQAIESGEIVGLAHHTVLIARNGREIAIDDSAAPIRDRNGEVVGAVMVFHDVTPTRELSRQLSWQAIHDPLTGLVNRREFEQRLELAVLSAKSQPECHALCYLDLDQFKIVNDTCGHVAGDELLRQVTTLLQEHIRKTDTLARLGGDEFGILLMQCTLNQAVRVANILREKIYLYRFVWQEHTFSIGASIGLVAINSESESVANLLIAADSACYAAKNNGRNRLHIYRADDREVLQQQGEVRWATRITKALEENRFCLYAQRISSISAAEVTEEHYEVLLRLQDEERKLVLPMAFIPAAERYNLMHRIDRWVVSTLFQHWSRLQTVDQPESDYKQRAYAINLSGSSINDEEFIDFLHAQFMQYAVAPHLICFEITETVAIANLTKANQFIRNLQQLGCRFALDDFGSGMSSFAYLKHLSVNYLKIDGGFIKNMVNDPVDNAMVEAIAQIGHVMGLKTIAEFVENDATLERLKALRVDYAQGYGIARPSPLILT